LNIITKKRAADGTFGQVNFKSGFRSIETYGNDKAHQCYGIDATYNARNDKWNVSLGANYQRNDLGGRREGDVYTRITDIKTQFPSTGEGSFDEINFTDRFNLESIPNLTNVFSLALFAGKRIKGRLADIIYYNNHAISITDIDNRLYTFQYFNHNLRERKSDFALGSFDYSYMLQNNSKLSASFLYEYTLLGGPTVNQNLGFPDNSILYQDEFNTNDNSLHGIRLQIDYTFKPF
jgi:hypothetical protein